MLPTSSDCTVPNSRPREDPFRVGLEVFLLLSVDPEGGTGKAGAGFMAALTASATTACMSTADTPCAEAAAMAAAITAVMSSETDTDRVCLFTSSGAVVEGSAGDVGVGGRRGEELPPLGGGSGIVDMELSMESPARDTCCLYSTARQCPALIECGTAQHSP